MTETMKAALGDMLAEMQVHYGGDMAGRAGDMIQHLVEDFAKQLRDLSESSPHNTELVRRFQQLALDRAESVAGSR